MRSKLTVIREREKSDHAEYTRTLFNTILELKRSRDLLDRFRKEAKQEGVNSILVDLKRVRDLKEINLKSRRADLRELNEREYRITLISERSYGRFQAYGFLKVGTSEFSLMKKLRDEIRQQIQIERTRNRTPNEDYSRVTGNYTLVGGVHLEPGAVLTVLKRRKSKVVFEAKKPKNNERHVAVEIEFLSSLGQDEIGEMLLEAGLETKVHLKGDGSVRDERVYLDGHEIAVMDSEEAFPETLSKVCAVLKLADARVNKTCGLHVHLDQRQEVTEDFRNSPWVDSARALIAAQSLLFKLVPKSRRSNKYCRRTRQVLNDDRYKAINGLGAMRKFRTIEVRLHSGTTEFEKIMNWVSLLKAIVSKREILNSEDFSTPRSIQGWARVLELNSNLTEYFKNRALKFQDETAEESNQVAA